MDTAHDILIRKLTEHSRLDPEDEVALRMLTVRVRGLEPAEDLVSEGENSESLAVVMAGLLARYHTRRDGTRQFLSFHMAGELPDAQSLFLETMDHSVCSMGPSRIGFVGREEVLNLIRLRPSVGAAIWRSTLIDAAIFRAALIKIGTRPRIRMAHLFCELYYRARSTGIAKQGSYELPLHQGQIGDALVMSLVTVNRTLQGLRRTGAIQFRNGHVTINDWPRLAEIGHFDPAYLHIRRPVRL